MEKGGKQSKPRADAKEVAEGKVKINISKNVFYNPEMRLCRDVSTILLKALNENKKLENVLDLTSATGVRGIRYIKEAGVKEGVFVDLSREACSVTRKNLRKNKAKGIVINSPISLLKGRIKEKFDVIDLDPFGTPVPYLSDSIYFAKDKTILFVTATDTAVLFGAQPKACLKNYGSYTLHNEFQNEIGTRILIYRILRAASELNFGLKILFAFAKRHYVRIALELDEGADEAYASNKKVGYINYCYRCLERTYSKFGTEKCSEGHKNEIAGPLWLGELYDKSLVKKALEISKKDGDTAAEKIFETALDEVEAPYYYNLHHIAKVFKAKLLKNEEVINKLKDAGFRASRTLFCPYGIKTDASIAEVRKAMGS